MIQNRSGGTILGSRVILSEFKILRVVALILLRFMGPKGVVIEEWTLDFKKTIKNGRNLIICNSMLLQK